MGTDTKTPLIFTIDGVDLSPYLSTVYEPTDFALDDTADTDCVGKLRGWEVSFEGSMFLPKKLRRRIFPKYPKNRKRFIKLCMSWGISRNSAVKLAKILRGEDTYAFAWFYVQSLCMQELTRLKLLEGVIQ